MDGRSGAAATSGELRAGIDRSGGGVAYEARGYKQGWETLTSGKTSSRRPKSSLQSNYSSTAILHGRPVVLRPVRATPCLIIELSA